MHICMSNVDFKDYIDNGMILENVIVENNLVVVNGTPKCEGVITRYQLCD